MWKIILLGVTFLIFVQNSFGQNYNRPVPVDLYPYEYTQYSTGYIFYLGLNPFKLNSLGQVIPNNSARSLILDNNGYVVWYRDSISGITRMSSFSYVPEHGIFSDILISNPATMEFATLNDQLQQTSTIVPLSVAPDAHDYQIISNGNHVITTKPFVTMDLSSFVFSGTQGDPATNVRCGGIQEFDYAGNLVFSWNSCDEIEPTEMIGFPYNSQDFDYFHINSVDETEDGNFIISGRHTSNVVKVNRTTGAIIWRLGGNNSDFTFVGDPGFTAQHDARDLGNGLISIFDNGNLSNPQKSRGVVYQLDTVNWTATLVSSIEDNTPHYGMAMGSHRVFEGNSILNFGMIYRPHPNVVGFDQNNVKSFEITFPDSVISYRAIPFELDFTLPRPEITCLDSNGVIYFKAPDGYSNYKWSNGDLTQAIAPSVGENYQVYVPYGVGFLASFPVSYNGICDLGVDDLMISKKSLIRTIDLLGREVKHQENGVVYIQVYSDGTTQKVMKGL